MKFWALLRRYGYVCALCILASSCAVERESPSWITSSRFKIQEYKKAKVGIAPIVVNNQYPSDVDFSRLQQLVRDELWILDIHDAEIQPAGYEGPFPWTPARLAAYGQAHGLDGVLGISIFDWSRNVDTTPAAFAAMIVFADVNRSSRRWTLFKRWTLGRGYKHWEDVEPSLKAGLFEIRGSLKKGRKSFWIRPNTIVAQAGPAICIYSSELDVARGDATTKSVLHLDVFAIDDVGMKTFDIRTSEVESLDGQTLAASSAKPMDESLTPLSGTSRNWEEAQQTAESLPIFYFTSVDVPMRLGANVVRVSGVNALNEPGERTIKIDGEGLQTRANVLAVSINSYQILPAAGNGPSRSFSDAVSGLDTQKNKIKPTILRDAEATRSAVLMAIARQSSAREINDVNAFYFSGKVRAVSGGAIFSMFDSEATKASDVHSIAARDLAQTYDDAKDLLIIDACSGEDEWSVAEALNSSLPDGSVFRVRPCGSDAGGISKLEAVNYKKPGDLRDAIRRSLIVTDHFMEVVKSK
jgi:hypothetical protein